MKVAVRRRWKRWRAAILADIVPVPVGLSCRVGSGFESRTVLAREEVGER
jgi:hypothetical protein